MNKKNLLKVSCLIVMVLVFVGISVYIYKLDNKNGDNTTQNVLESEKKEYVINKENTADLAIDFSKTENLVSESDLVAIVTIQTKEGKNYNSVKSKYVPVYTTGKLLVKEVISDINSTGIEKDDILNYVRLGGDIEYSEYVKGLSEAEKNKFSSYATANISTDLSTVDVIVKDKFVGDIEVEQNKEYLVFLKYSNDYQKYNILGFEHGLREYNSTTNSIKNNETNQFESLNTMKQDILNETI